MVPLDPTWWNLFFKFPICILFRHFLFPVHCLVVLHVCYASVDPRAVMHPTVCYAFLRVWIFIRKIASEKGFANKVHFIAY